MQATRNKQIFKTDIRLLVTVNKTTHFKSQDTDIKELMFPVASPTLLFSTSRRMLTKYSTVSNWHFEPSVAHPHSSQYGNAASDYCPELYCEIPV